MYHLQTRNTGAPAFPEGLLPQMRPRLHPDAGEEETQAGNPPDAGGRQDQIRAIKGGATCV